MITITVLAHLSSFPPGKLIDLAGTLVPPFRVC